MNVLEENEAIRFRRAIAYCLAYERLDKDAAIELSQRARNYQRMTPQSSDLADKILYYADLAIDEALRAEYQARPTNHPLANAWRDLEFKDSKVLALVYGGATKIKGYVFESARLPEVRGASTLFDRINLEDIPALWGNRGNDMAGEVSALIESPECIIYASGGNFLAFAPLSAAADLANAVEKRYTTETLVGNSAVVWEAFSLLELQYGRNPDSYWYDDYQQDMQNDQKSILEAYYSYPADLDPGTPEGRFYQRKTFGELVTVLAGKMMRRRGGWGQEDGQLPRFIPHFELLPYAVKCHSCDVRPAVVRDDMAEKEYCEACARKRVIGQMAKRVSGVEWFTDAFPDWPLHTDKSWEDRFDAFLEGNNELKEQYYARGKEWGWEPGNSVTAARDLREIGAGSKPERYVGLIYADGNNVGAQVARLTSPNQYSQFSQRLSDVTEEAVFEALARCLGPVYVTEANKETRRISAAWVHPFEIITIGGDDLILLVPGSKALDVALNIGQRLEECLGKDPPDGAHFSLYEGQRYQPYSDHGQGLKPVDASWSYEADVSLSAGVVIAHETTPIFFLHDLAEQLLKSAKRWRKDLGKQRQKEGKTPYRAGTVDFLALKSVGMVASRLGEFRDRALTNPAGHRLTARPYTWIELEGLLNTVRALQASGFARSQIFQMQDFLDQGLHPAAVNYLYNFIRLRVEDRQELARTFHFAWHHPAPDGAPHLPPWRYLGRDKENECDMYETVWRDLVEIYDFIEKGEEV